MLAQLGPLEHLPGSQEPQNQVRGTTGPPAWEEEVSSHWGSEHMKWAGVWGATVRLGERDTDGERQRQRDTERQRLTERQRETEEERK